MTDSQITPGPTKESGIPSNTQFSESNISEKLASPIRSKFGDSISVGSARELLLLLLSCCGPIAPAAELLGLLFGTAAALSSVFCCGLNRCRQRHTVSYTWLMLIRLRIFSCSASSPDPDQPAFHICEITFARRTGRSLSTTLIRRIDEIAPLNRNLPWSKSICRENELFSSFISANAAETIICRM